MTILKNLYLSLIFLCALAFSATAETWNGSVSTDWNTAANWTPATVPSATSTVSIPTFAIINYPQLSADITIERITMSSGAKLDVNGFMVTVLGGAGNNVFSTDTINNSAPGTNIVFNIAAGAGYSTRISRSVFTDTVVFNLTGVGTFFEGYNATPNLFNNAVTYNISSTLSVYTSYISETNYLESLTVNRTTAGTTYILQDGGNIAGDFSYTNNAGGESRVGSAGNVTLINGVIDIAINNIVTAPFRMRKVTNLTTGGNISVQNSLGFTLQDDTLSVSSISMLGYTGSAYGYMYYNDITGNLTLSPDSSYAGGYFTALRDNVVTGNTVFNNAGSNAFYEGFAGSIPEVFNGNTVFNGTGSGSLFISNSDPTVFNGDLTVNRTVAGTTNIFYSSATVSGDFEYNNNAGGSTTIGDFNNKTVIAGMVDLDVDLTTPGIFNFYNITNQTNGGTMSVVNTLGFSVQKDTLSVNSISLLGYEGSQFSYFYDNEINGDLNVSSDSNYVGGYQTVLRRNTITGNSQITINSSNVLSEANSSNSANIYNGNTVITANGTGTLNICANDKSTFNGDLTITRNVAGTTDAFSFGADVNGNFVYNNNTSGGTYLGNNTYPTNITGTISLLANYSSLGIFDVRYIKNQTTGGIVDVRNTQGFNFRYDSLKVASASFLNYRGSNYGRLFDCEIFGDLTISDDSTFVGGYNTELRNNTITGNTVGTMNSSNDFQEANIAGTANTFNGNTIFNANGTGTLRISTADKSTYNGDVSVNRTKVGVTRLFTAGAIINGDFLFNNMIAGDTYMGTVSEPTLISGTIDVSVNDTVPDIFRMYRLINQTTGGIIDIQNTRGVRLYNDTLKVSSLNVSGYRGTANAIVTENEIEGNVTISSDSNFSGGYSTSINANKFIGNASFTNNGTTNFFDANGANNGNEYLGNVMLTKGQGDIRFANDDTSSISGDLILNSISDILLGTVKFNGSTHAVIDQLGTQAIEIDEIIMDKTGADLTLNKAVSVNDAAVFMGGRILSDSTNKLSFENNATATVLLLNSHVDGVVSKIGNDAFTFPIGKNSKYAPIGISAPGNVTDEFTAEYFEAMPHTSGYDSSMKDASIDHISQNEYWICDRTVGTSDVEVVLSWRSDRSGIVNNIGDLLVCRWDGAAWKDEGQVGATGSFSAGTVTSNTVTNFSPFTLGSSTANNPLPLTLLNFEAKKDEKTARLFWTTENEEQFSHFEIERSTDGVNFEKLNQLVARGNNETTKYEIIDANPITSKNYYRLKAVDDDQIFNYSEIRMLDFSIERISILYPNPAKDVLYINSDNDITAIQIFDVAGSLIYNIESKNISQLDLADYAKGIYFIKLFQLESVESFRIIKE